VGEHVTEGKEEVVIVLQGQGELHCNGSGVMKLSTGDVAYVPPETAHDIRNTGTGTLEYIFVVSPVK
jgi:mannose-6-phosphate isomerase-like protein (cupin superfamily)